MHRQSISGRIRAAQGSKGGLLLLLVLSADWRLDVSQLAAAEAPYHPYLDEKDLKSETCLTCHPTKNRGKFVHSAMNMGCQNCHRATSRDGQTAVTLLATGGSLCAKCHAVKVGPVQHEPYTRGECLICHNPHAGDYVAETRATVSLLCLSCHMPNQPEATMSADRKHVALFNSIPYDAAAWERAPKINARHFEEKNPAAQQEPSDRPRNLGDAEASCLTCHEPHASRAEHLLRFRAENRGTAAVSMVGAGPSHFLSATTGLNYAPQTQGAYLRGQWS